MALPNFPAFEVQADNNVGPRWGKWISRFERLITAMDIENPVRMQALLLHYGGPDLDEIHDTLTIEAPDQNHDVYQRSKDALTAYFTPKKNTAFEVYTFRQAAQLEGEKTDTFVMRLRKLAKSCDFTEPEKEIANQVIFSCSSQPLRHSVSHCIHPLLQLPWSPS